MWLSVDVDLFYDLKFSCLNFQVEDNTNLFLRTSSNIKTILGR
jgi:hypothetical protein